MSIAPFHIRRREVHWHDSPTIYRPEDVRAPIVRNSGIAMANTGAFGTAGGGGTGNAFTLVQSKAQATLGILLMTGNWVAGNLLAILVKWEGSGSVTNIVTTLSSTAFTAGNVTDFNNSAASEPHSQIWFLNIAPAASNSITPTTTGIVTFGEMVAMEFSATGTHALDAQASGTGAYGTSTSLVSGTASSSVSTGLAIGGYGEYTSGAISAAQIGGTNADAVIQVTSNSAAAWYRLFSSTLTNATATCTTPNNRWVANLALFKST